jgi:hypothetical protein
MLFEPTGDLLKDYSAFCEINQRPERDDIVDGILYNEGTTPPTTMISIRNVDYCLNKRDALPLCLAIPHCPNLTTVQLVGCGVTEYSYKVFTEAIYKTGSVHTFSVDFNPNGLFKDPAVSKKDKNEVTVLPSQFRGAHLLKPAETDVKDEKKGGKPDPKKAALIQQHKEQEAVLDKQPIILPTGWHSILLTGVQVLSLRGNGIDDKQVELLAQGLSSNTDLLSLSLWGNEITTTGAVMIANALKTNRKLTCINLGSNKINDAGVAAFAQLFYTSDVSHEEALQARQRIVPNTELPQYPTYAELASVVVQPEDAKAKDPKKKEAPAKPGKKGAEGPAERPKGEFDKDCIKLDDQRVRIPGNTALWAVSFAQNMLLTKNAAQEVIKMLQTREPSVEELLVDGVLKEPAPYAAGIQLQHFDVSNTLQDGSVQESLNKALQANIAWRK